MTSHTSPSLDKCSTRNELLPGLTKDNLRKLLEQFQLMNKRYHQTKNGSQTLQGI